LRVFGKGWFGSGLIILAYYLLQTNKIEETDLKYQLINIFGALMLSVNAYSKQAFAILALQIAWIIIGLVGMMKSKNSD